MAECKKFKIANEFLKKHEWPIKLTDARYNRCFCKVCYTADMRDTYIVGGKTYVVPRGYTRIGLRIDEAFADHHNVWSDWMNCFHGTSVTSAKSIVEHRMLLLPGEETMGGKEIAIRKGHIPGEVFFFTTPTVKYASLPVYASRYEFLSPSDKNYYNITVVLQCKQKPDSFVVQRETVGAGSKQICSFIKNDSVEWKSKQRASIIPYGMLLQIERAGSRLEAISRRGTRMDVGRSAPKSCEIEWDQAECPHCFKPTDWLNPKYNQGVILQCASRCCNVKFKPFNCPYCCELFTICDCYNRYDSETFFGCTNKKCGKELMSSKCPHCADGFNYGKMPNANQSVSITCSGKACKKKYNAFLCPHCRDLRSSKTVVGKEGVVATCKQEACLRKYQLAVCPSCANVNVFPNAVKKFGSDDVVTCAYKGCGMKFKQPLQPLGKTH